MVRTSTPSHEKAVHTYQRCYDILLFEKNDSIDELVDEIFVQESQWNTPSLARIIEKKKKRRSEILSRDLPFVILFPFRSLATSICFIFMVAIILSVTFATTGGLAPLFIVPSLVAAYLVSAMLETKFKVMREQVDNSDINLLETRLEQLSDDKNTSIQEAKKTALEALTEKKVRVIGMINDHLTVEQREHQRCLHDTPLKTEDLYTLSDQRLQETMYVQTSYRFVSKKLLKLIDEYIDEPFERFNELLSYSSPYKITSIQTEEIKQAIQSDRQPYRRDVQKISLSRDNIENGFRKPSSIVRNGANGFNQTDPLITEQFLLLVNTYSKNSKHLLIPKNQQQAILNAVKHNYSTYERIERNYEDSKKSLRYDASFKEKKSGNFADSNTYKPQESQSLPRNHEKTSPKKEAWTTSSNIRNLSQFTGITERSASEFLNKLDHTGDQINDWTKEQVRRQNLIEQGIDPDTGKARRK